MAHSSHIKGNISIDLFNLPGLPDERKATTMSCEIFNDFFLPDEKNSRLSQIVNTWTFGRLTPMMVMRVLVLKCYTCSMLMV